MEDFNKQQIEQHKQQIIKIDYIIDRWLDDDSAVEKEIETLFSIKDLLLQKIDHLENKVGERRTFFTYKK
jgi:hypothetical protein